MWNWCRMFSSINRGWCLTHDFCFVSPMTLQESPNVSERQELQSLVSKWRADDMEAWASLVPLIPKILHFLPSIFVGTWNKSPKYSKSILSTDTGINTLDRWFMDTDVGKWSKEVWSVGFDSGLMMDTSCMPTSYRVVYCLIASLLRLCVYMRVHEHVLFHIMHIHMHTARKFRS